MLSLNRSFGFPVLIIMFMTTEIKSSEYKQCYWNSQSTYPYFSSKTPYDTVRGNIRDNVDPPKCQAISIWSIMRHGTRYPSRRIMDGFKILLERIENEHENASSQLCAQDAENLRKWRLSTEAESNPLGLTPAGYKESYGIAQRIREKYPHLLTSRHEVFVQPTKESRTLDSAKAFVDGISAHTDLNLKHHPERKVATPYEHCDRFHHNLKNNPVHIIEGDKFYQTEEELAVKRAVQQRLGVATQLSDSDIWTLYDMCRYGRSWDASLKSPWCALFSNDDLKILEYRDDVKRYHRNGYAIWYNPRLGAQPLKDLYERFEAAIKGKGKKVVAYISHGTMIELMFTALDMFKDAEPLTGSRILHERLWRNSFNNPMANNFIAVLYKCEDSGSQYKMQLLHNEKLSGICPETGCTWDQFTEKFSRFLNVSLDFCNLDYPEPALNVNLH